MANPDLITALQNAIDRGESLEEAVTILINSGYNQKEVQEASHYVGGGLLTSMRPKPEEELTMPNQKSSFGSLKPWNKDRAPAQNQPMSIQMPSSDERSQIKQGVTSQAMPPLSTQGQQGNQAPRQLSPQAIASPQNNALYDRPYAGVQMTNQAPQSESQRFMKNLGITENSSPRDTQQMIINQSRAGDAVNETPTAPRNPVAVANPVATSYAQPQAMQEKPYKKSYAKEIILLVILLFLIGLLATTIIFKNTIVGWFS